jgi:hypothetical protein
LSGVVFRVARGGGNDPVGILLAALITWSLSYEKRKLALQLHQHRSVRVQILSRPIFFILRVHLSHDEHVTLAFFRVDVYNKEKII